MRSVSRSAFATVSAALVLVFLVNCGGKTTGTEPDSAELGGAASTSTSSSNGGSTSTVGTTGSSRGGAVATTEDRRTVGGGGSPTTSKSWIPAGGGASPRTSGSVKGGASGTNLTVPKGGASGTPLSSSYGGSTVAPRPPAVHRPTAQSCVGVHSPAEPTNNPYPDLSSCTKHADCTDGVNGKCVNGPGMAARMFYCAYDQCATDADCDPGKMCYCSANTAARCLAIGNCQSDADCGGGPYSYCSPSMSWDCGGHRPIDGSHCHTPLDTCMDDLDCTGTDYCNFNVYEARWKCTPTDQSCVIG
jgi:hypothetical protein